MKTPVRGDRVYSRFLLTGVFACYETEKALPLYNHLIVQPLY